MCGKISYNKVIKFYRGSQGGKLELGTSSNVMSLKVMNQLGLKTTRPYKSVCAMESRDVKVCSLIQDLSIKLEAHLNISHTMDVVVIDVPNT